MLLIKHNITIQNANIKIDSNFNANKYDSGYQKKINAQIIRSITQ